MTARPPNSEDRPRLPRRFASLLHLHPVRDARHVGRSYGPRGLHALRRAVVLLVVLGGVAPALCAAHTAGSAVPATAAKTALDHAAASTTAASTAPGWTLDQLMSALGHRKSGRARFAETKYLSIATAPIESSGELAFDAPDHLEKRTDSPKPEDLVVDGDMLTIARNGHRYTLALAHYPVLAAFIDSLRGTLTGNRYALEAVYQVALAGSRNDWTLTLTPRDAQMRASISTITLAGAQDQLRTVAIRQANGDHSLMRLQNDTHDAAR
jgi:hypothetical protein